MVGVILSIRFELPDLERLYTYLGIAYLPQVA
jgi:hypothetical protein